MQVLTTAPRSPQVPALRLLSQIPPQHASAHHGVLSPQVPDFEWEEHPITRVCRRKFAFAREVNHPGYRGDPWLAEQAAAAPNIFERRVNALLATL